MAVIAYPDIEDDDRRWIEPVRACHDPPAGLIRAHFTLVFPADLPATVVADHASKALADCRPVSFVVRRAEAVRDPITGVGGHVFLVPDEGREAIAALHDRLYGGALRPHLRENVPFTPHITVAASPDFAACERLAASLNEPPRVVRGLLREVEVVEVGAGGLRSVRGFALKVTTGGGHDSTG